jgi:hypothetical protein
MESYENIFCEGKGFIFFYAYVHTMFGHYSAQPPPSKIFLRNTYTLNVSMGKEEKLR